MEHINFAFVLSSALTPITLISGVGLLLMTMSARYAHTTSRVRELLKTRNLVGGGDAALDHQIELIFKRATLLRKAILLVALSATSSGLLVLTSVVESLFQIPFDDTKNFFLLCSVGFIVVSTMFFAWEVHISVTALGLSVHNRK